MTVKIDREDRTVANYELLLQCYRSGQISGRQWQEHLRDEVFRKWLKSNGVDVNGA